MRPEMRVSITFGSGGGGGVLAKQPAGEDTSEDRGTEVIIE
jgi:hypothetical protein